MIALLKFPVIAAALFFITGSNYFTNCVTITGHVKNYKYQVVKRSHKILVYQGRYLATDTNSDRQGRLNFDVCLGANGDTSAVDFFTASGKDTLLMASISGFDSDEETPMDLFLPVKAHAGRICFKCKRGDRLYELVYDLKRTKKFTRAPYKFYCLYDKVKF